MLIRLRKARDMNLLPQFANRHDNIDSLLNQVHHADAMDLLVRLPDDSVDMVLCDLPYGTTQAFYDEILPLDDMWFHLQRISKEKTAIVLTAMQPFSSLLVCSNLPMFKYEWIWKKTRKTNFLNAKIMPLAGHEVILIFGHSMPSYYPQMKKSRGHETGAKQHRGSILYGEFNGDYYGTRNEYYPDTVFECSHDPELSVTYKHRKNKIKTHPNQKPVALFEYLIKTYTKENEIVLDMTCGSGTTAIACKKTNRQFICGDITQEYVDIANQRLQTTDPYQDTPLSNGKKQLSLFSA